MTSQGSVKEKSKHFEMKKRYIRMDGTIVRVRLIASVALRSSGKPTVVINMVEEMDD